MNFFHAISDRVKGNLLILAGIVLLLNTLGATVKVIYFLTLAGAIFMIGYGFMQAGYYQMIEQMITKRHHN